MTRQDFKLIADVLKEAKPLNHVDPNEYEKEIWHGRDMNSQWQATINMFANALAETNPNFDENKFLTACGL